VSWKDIAAAWPPAREIFEHHSLVAGKICD
jgi:hypothetical protein